MRLVGARSGVAQEVISPTSNPAALASATLRTANASLLVLSDILTKVNLTPAFATRVHLMALAPLPPASF